MFEGQLPEDKQMVPDSLGKVHVLLSVRVVGSNVPKNDEPLSPITTSPVLATLKRVVPEADAVRISWDSV